MAARSDADFGASPFLGSVTCGGVNLVAAAVFEGAVALDGAVGFGPVFEDAVAFDKAAVFEDAAVFEGAADFEWAAAFEGAAPFEGATFLAFAAFGVVALRGLSRAVGVHGSLVVLFDRLSGVRERGASARSHPRSAIVLLLTDDLCFVGEPRKRIVP